MWDSAYIEVIPLKGSSESRDSSLILSSEGPNA